VDIQGLDAVLGLGETDGNCVDDIDEVEERSGKLGAGQQDRVFHVGTSL
jgi:hypothetical protein